MGKIAVVAISGATREYDKLYHYLVPEEFEESILPGMRVIVPFGRGDSPKEGYVFGFAGSLESRPLKNKKVI